MSSNKRKKTFLSLEEKIKVLKLNDGGKSARVIATELGVGKTQIQTIIKNKEEIMAHFAAGSSADRKILSAARRLKWPELDKKVYEWFKNMRAHNLPISGRLLQEQARLIAEKLEIPAEEFKAANGWLFKFQQRFNISQRILSGEEADVSSSVLEKWTPRLKTLVAGYESRDIFNADESGLLYRSAPKRSLVERGDSCKGGKLSKERITFLICTSASGEKLPLLVIGRSIRPRCFSQNNIEISRLGVHYEAQRKAWMSSEIWERWIKSLNNKMRLKNRHIVILVDNCAAHSKLTLSNIKLVFLPPNTTSKLQPQDAGIIQCVKLHYRKKLLRRLVSLMDGVISQDGDGRMSDVAKQVTILDAIQMLKASYDELEISTIKKCFQRCGVPATDADAEADDLDTQESVDDLHLIQFLPEGVTINAWAESDDSVLTSDDTMPSIDDVIPSVPSDGASSDEDKTPASHPLSTGQALEFTRQLRLYSVSQSLPTTALKCLDSLETEIIEHSFLKLSKQLKITDHFLRDDS